MGPSICSTTSNTRTPDGFEDAAFVSFENLRGETAVYALDEIRPYAPVIVVSIDAEENLFREIDVYHALKQYSWRDELPRPPMMARPMGAFLYFREPPPEAMVPNGQSLFALTPSGVRVHGRDPWRAIRSLSPGLQAVMTHENGCISCHAYGGTGGRAGHLKLTDGSRHGGFALPLVDYPPAVWRRFVYHQEDVAAEIGASPNPVPEAQRDALFRLIEDARSPAK